MLKWGGVNKIWHPKSPLTGWLLASVILFTDQMVEATHRPQICDLLPHMLRMEAPTFFQGFGNPRRPAGLSQSTGASS